MIKYKGSCHCNNVKFHFFAPKIERGLRCNCSICARKGATMTEFTISAEDFYIDDNEGALSVYEFGTCVAKHYFCSQCGIYTFHQSMSKPGHYRINTGCLEDIESTTLPFDVFDGASI